MAPHLSIRPRVLKLGGSLLDLPDLRERINNWMIVNPYPVNLMIVGGGELVESIRHLDAVHKLDPRFVHWLCVDLLAHTARIAAQVLVDWELIDNRMQLQRNLAHGSDHLGIRRPTMAIVMVGTFYDRKAVYGKLENGSLSEDWNSTSDSLAALLAKQVNAVELVIFKSTTIDGQQLPFELAASGVVDSSFPAIVSDSYTFRIVNLRR